MNCIAVAQRLLTTSIVFSALLLMGCEPEPDSPPATPIFACANNQEQNTDVAILAPAVNGTVTAGTELRWERPGHEYCGDFGASKRYSVAICAASGPGLCNPANGFYNANVSPEDLGWAQTDPGRYTLTAEHINDIQDKAGVTPGNTVYFQIRYNYTSFNNVYGEWDVRALAFNQGPVQPVTVPTSAPTILNLPETYPANSEISINWQPVNTATFYRAQLTYRAPDPSGTDMGTAIGVSSIYEFNGTNGTIPEPLPNHTHLVVWKISACNVGGCGPATIQGAFVNPPTNNVNFSSIVEAFRAPSCMNCHAVDANGGVNQPANGYESGDNFGLPPNHPSSANCVSCHTAALMPEGSHPVPWQAAPASMDLRGKTDAELCQMANNPGSLAENITDHLLGDPLILWAAEGGPLPNGTNTDVAFSGNWENAVLAWVNGGASCL